MDMSSDVAREQSWGTGESLRLVLSLNGSWSEGRLPKMIFQTTGMTGCVCGNSVSKSRSNFELIDGIAYVTVQGAQGLLDGLGQRRPIQ